MTDPAPSSLTSEPVDFHVQALIAEGGMGAVYAAWDPALKRVVALKTLRPELTESDESRRRFTREALITGQLQHPGVVPTYAYCARTGQPPFLVMQLIAGESLAAALAARPAPGDDLARFIGAFMSICQTMAYAHEHGVIHRDLKSANIMLGPFGEVQVVDWGVAKIIDPAAFSLHDRVSRDRGESPLDAELPLSSPGAVLGTPQYMSPEQAHGKLEMVDRRADVFSLGAILCEILTGAPPYCGVEGPVLREAGMAMQSECTKRLDDCGADRELVALTRECLAPVREARPASASEVALRIAQYTQSVSARAHDAKLQDSVAAELASTKARAHRLALALSWSILLLLVMGGALGFQLLRLLQG